MKNREQYIEPLIKLIELNDDKYWLQAFLDLRKGHGLPGGGAGSLNDWGPYYSDQIEYAWYSNLYRILRQLFDNDLSAKEIYCNKEVKFNNNVHIIRCLNCNKNYQHPSVFERHISSGFYSRNFVNLAKNKQLLNLFNPEQTYKSFAVNEYRDWLKKEYEVNDIKIYDFVNAKYICPHCEKDHSETEHDLYVVKGDGVNKIFQRQMQNTKWEDFEREY
jgi:hypothetical protein